MKKISFLCIILFCFIALLVSSCSGGTSESKKEETVVDSTSSKKDTAKQAFKVYSLPAPMQIPTAIRNLSAKFNEEYLKPSDNLKPSGDNDREAFILGILGVDMGYCSVYGQNQAVMNYMSKIARLAQDINITGAFAPSVIERLKANVSHPDSASYILLSSFNNARNFLKENKREGTSYLIGGGSLIEGLHMTTSILKKQRSPDMLKLLGIQKFFLTDVDELLGMYSTEENMKPFYSGIDDLKKLFDDVKVEMTGGDKKNKQEISNVVITDEQLAAITKRVDEIRASVLK